MQYLFVLGAGDPEMSAIEKICKNKNHTTLHATAQGRRVHPGNAYKADPITIENRAKYIVIWVECRSASLQSNDIIIDHHALGDPGFGYLAENYWLGSSLGQTCQLLGVAPTEKLNIIAAADHCLGHAYQGLCPGVEPRQLRTWRAESRAAFQGISVLKIMEEIESGIKTIAEMPTTIINGHTFIDSRGFYIKEFSEASAILGKAAMYDLRDKKSGRLKVGVLNGTHQEIAAWMDWSKSFLNDCYGDPHRGYAGGYMA